MLEITVYGASGTGKSSYAEAVQRAAEREGLKVAVCDHELFNWYDGFAKSLTEVKGAIAKSAPDISIVVINDKGKLRIEFDSHLSHRFHHIVFPNSTVTANA